MRNRYADVRTSKMRDILLRLKTLVDRLGSGPRLMGRLGSGVRVNASFPQFTRSLKPDHTTA